MMGAKPSRSETRATASGRRCAYDEKAFDSVRRCGEGGPAFNSRNLVVGGSPSVTPCAAERAPGLASLARAMARKKKKGVRASQPGRAAVRPREHAAASPASERESVDIGASAPLIPAADAVPARPPSDSSPGETLLAGVAAEVVAPPRPAAPSPERARREHDHPVRSPRTGSSRRVVSVPHRATRKLQSTRPDAPREVENDLEGTPPSPPPTSGIVRTRISRRRSLPARPARSPLDGASESPAAGETSPSSRRRRRQRVSRLGNPLDDGARWRDARVPQSDDDALTREEETVIAYRQPENPVPHGHARATAVSRWGPLRRRTRYRGRISRRRARCRHDRQRHAWSSPERQPGSDTGDVAKQPLLGAAARKMAGVWLTAPGWLNEDQRKDAAKLLRGFFSCRTSSPLGFPQQYARTCSASWARWNVFWTS